MFDHVKCVVGLTTMVCHVYDPPYYKVMIIAICDMQYENIKVQQIMWKMPNETMLKNRFPKPKFKGFMADNTQANWNVVKIVYGFGDLSIKMVDKKCTCLFHWTQLLDRHNK